MVDSAINFAAGFFGIPMYQTEYHQVIAIENAGFNDTGSPYKTCTNANRAIGRLPHISIVETNGSSGNFGVNESNAWVQIYLQGAVKRLQPQIIGINLTVSDVFAMQQTCAYEV